MLLTSWRTVGATLTVEMSLIPRLVLIRTNVRKKNFMFIKWLQDQLPAACITVKSSYIL
jgi:hypothetical protein